MKTVKEIIYEKLVFNKHTKAKQTKFYNFDKSIEINKILSICGFNDTNHKPSDDEIRILQTILHHIKKCSNAKLLENKTYYALLDTRMYNILDNTYRISQYKDYIEIDNDKYDKLFDNRYNSYTQYSIEPDYCMYKYYQSTNILYSDTRNPDEEINIFFIMK